MVKILPEIMNTQVPEDYGKFERQTLRYIMSDDSLMDKEPVKHICCCDVTTWTFVIAGVHYVLSAFLLFLGLNAFFCESELEEEINNKSINFVFTVATKFAVQFVLVSSLGFALTSIMFLGVILKKTLLLLIWQIVQGIQIFVLGFILLFILYALVVDPTFSTIFVAVLAVAYSTFELFCLGIVSCHKNGLDKLQRQLSRGNVYSVPVVRV